jgi:hypothetical protein
MQRKKLLALGSVVIVILLAFLAWVMPLLRLFSSEEPNMDLDSFSKPYMNDSAFKKAIDPFSWDDFPDGRASLALHMHKRYKKEVFAARSGEGFRGNGYDWDALALVFLEERPDIAGKVEHDPNTGVSKGKMNFDSEGGMFAIYSEASDVDALAKFALEFKAACENDTLIRDLFSRAKTDHILTPERLMEGMRKLREELGWDAGSTGK